MMQFKCINFQDKRRAMRQSGVFLLFMDIQAFFGILRAKFVTRQFSSRNDMLIASRFSFDRKSTAFTPRVLQIILCENVGNSRFEGLERGIIMIPKRSPFCKLLQALAYCALFFCRHVLPYSQIKNLANSRYLQFFPSLTSSFHFANCGMPLDIYRHYV